jgi:hypothetical protein
MIFRTIGVDCAHLSALGKDISLVAAKTHSKISIQKAHSKISIQKVIVGSTMLGPLLPGPMP